MNQAVIDYINKSRGLGYSDEDIKSLLLNAGHKEEGIRAAFDVVNGKDILQGENFVPTPPPPSQSPSNYPSAIPYSGKKKTGLSMRRVFYAFLGLLTGSALGLALFTMFLEDRISNVSLYNLASIASLLIGAAVGISGGLILAYAFTEPESSFPKVGVLVRNAWNLYRNRFKTLISISLIFAVMQYGITVFILNFGGNLISAIPLTILNWLIGIFMSLPLIYAVRENDIGFVRACSLAGGNIFSYIWIVILSALVIAGGIIMGIFPGIIFSLWFVFAVYAFVNEGDKGMGALLKSGEYLRGYTKVVLSRMYSIVLFLPTLPLLLIPYIFTLFGGQMTDSIVNSVITAILMPVWTVYFYVIYKELIKYKPDLLGKPVRGKKNFFVFSAILGLVGIAILIGWLAFSSIQRKTTLSSGALGIPTRTNQGSDLLSQTPYVDSANGFSINPPKGWAVVGSRTNGATFAPNGDLNTAGLAVTVDPLTRTDGTDLDAITNAAIQRFQTILDYKMIDDKNIITEQNIQARVLNFECTLFEQNFVTAVLYLVKGDNLYSVYSLSPKTSWDNYKDQIKQSALTIKVL